MGRKDRGATEGRGARLGQGKAQEDGGRGRKPSRAFKLIVQETRRTVLFFMLIGGLREKGAGLGARKNSTSNALRKRKYSVGAKRNGVPGSNPLRVHSTETAPGIWEIGEVVISGRLDDSHMDSVCTSISEATSERGTNLGSGSRTAIPPFARVKAATHNLPGSNRLIAPGAFNETAKKSNYGSFDWYIIISSNVGPKTGLISWKSLGHERVVKSSIHGLEAMWGSKRPPFPSLVS